jgi:FkbM family methyltransferase
LKRWRQDNGFDVTQELEVDCISLAQFVQEENLSRIDFLKLDTQGSELDILRGGGDFLR